jgi:hypothetical protein
MYTWITCIRVLLLASEYVSKQVRVVPSINRPTRVNPSVFWRLKNEPWHVLYIWRPSSTRAPFSVLFIEQTTFFLLIQGKLSYNPKLPPHNLLTRRPLFTSSHFTASRQTQSQESFNRVRHRNSTTIVMPIIWSQQ